jgi:hypothetical protein
MADKSPAIIVTANRKLSIRFVPLSDFPTWAKT